MSFPDVPFKAIVRDGSDAFSPDGARPWGKTTEKVVTVVALFSDKARINDPLWNGKEWCVFAREDVLTPVSDPPPVEPPPTTSLPSIPYSVTLGDDIDYQKETISGTLTPLK